MISSFLNSLYNHKSFTIEKQEEFQSVLDDIELFSVSSQVYQKLKETNRLHDTPSFFQDRLKEKYEKVAFQNMMLSHEMDDLLQLFEEKKIMVIPLKGIPFAKQYFGSIAARGSADIDLLVCPSDLQKSIDLLNLVGFREEKEEGYSNNHCCFYKHDLNAPFPINVELHWNLDKEYFSNINSQDIWEQTELYKEYEYVKLLSTQHTFYYMCLHGARHKMDSLKYFIDLIQIILTNHRSVSFEKLLIRAKEDKTYKRVMAVLSILYQQFPFLHEVKLLDKKVKTVWDLESAKRANTEDKNSKYYFYKFFFNLCLFDSIKYVIISSTIYHAILPPKNYLRYLMEIPDEIDIPTYRLYLLFYKQRLTHDKKIEQKSISKEV